MVLWTAGFVLLTLVINAPLLPMVLRLTGLNKGTVPTLSQNIAEFALQTSPLFLSKFNFDSFKRLFVLEVWHVCQYWQCGYQAHTMCLCV